MSWKVLVTASGLGKAGRQAESLLRLSGCELVMPPRFGPYPARDIEPLLERTDAVIASLDEFSQAVLMSPSASQLKIISRWGAGFDSVDIPAATRAGIVVTYTPGLLDEPVAEYTFALLLAMARRVPGFLADPSNGIWRPAWGNDLADKTLGIIGCGRIGLAVARRAAAFSLKLIGCDPKPITEPGIRSVTLDALLAESDFVSLHAALNDSSRGMIGEPQFRRMKSSALLINTARGALVDEAALAEALRAGRIAGAALDVFTTEPLPADNPLRSAPNLLISPHQGGFTFETGEKVSLAAAQSVLDLMQGRRPQHVVNPAVFTGGNLRAQLNSIPAS
jgi:phosphoglycerate dehydrogenase-like enzyme